MVKGRKKSKKDIPHDKIYLLLGVLVILFGLYNIVQTASFSNLFDEKMDEAKEAASPAELELVLLTDSACSDCFDIQAVIHSIKGSHVNITSEKELNFNSDEARDLIKKYGIDKVPTVLLFGETDKANVRDMEEADDALVFTSQVPPYTDASSGRILGRVSATLITDPSCTNCYDIEQILAGITQTGISVVSREDIDRSEAASLISKYSIDALPALILSKDFEVYGPGVVASWANFGSVESDAFVTRLKNPPYVEQGCRPCKVDCSWGCNL